MNQSSTTHRLQELIQLFPEFASYWASEGNFNRNDDGSFSLAGLWAEFSTCFEQHAVILSHEQLKGLAELVNTCLASPTEEERSCVSVCFLENVAGSSGASLLKPQLAEAGQSILKKWAPFC
jgi:hypothetical protein